MKVSKSLLKKFIKEEIYKQLNEAKFIQLKINKKDHDRARQLLKKAGLKDTYDFAFDALGLKGKMVGLGIVKKHEDNVLEIFIKNKIKVWGI